MWPGNWCPQPISASASNASSPQSRQKLNIIERLKDDAHPPALSKPFLKLQSALGTPQVPLTPPNQPETLIDFFFRNLVRMFEWVAVGPGAH